MTALANSASRSVILLVLRKLELRLGAMTRGSPGIAPVSVLRSSRVPVYSGWIGAWPPGTTVPPEPDEPEKGTEDAAEVYAVVVSPAGAVYTGAPLREESEEPERDWKSEISGSVSTAPG